MFTRFLDMMKKIIMFSIFLLIAWALNLFVLRNISSAWIISLIIVCFLLFSVLITRQFPSLVSRIFYFFSMTYIGVISQLFIYFLIADLLRLSRLYFFIFVLILTAYGLVHSRKIYVERYDLNIGKKIVFLSDLHIGPVNREKRINKVVSMTNSLNPDIVLIGGDLADMSTKLDSHLFVLFKKIRSPKYMVHGNHELYDGKKHVEELLDKAEIKILNNKIIHTRGITIIGIDYKGDPEKIIKKSKIKEKSILLIHEPVGEKIASKYNIDLVLSGHTHGGQFFPFTLIVKLFYRFTRGLNRYKGTNVVVSMGTLTWGPQIRIGSRNQIIFVE